MAKSKGKQSQQVNGPHEYGTPEEAAELRASLAAHNDSFSTLLGLIPAKHYLAKEDLLYGNGLDVDPEDTTQQSGKLSKKQRKQLKAQNEEAAKELALAKRQAKKAKYDPDTPRTVIEIQQAKAAAAAAASEGSSRKSDKLQKKQLANGIALPPINVSTSSVSAKASSKAKQAQAAINEDEEEDSPNETDFEDDEDEDDMPASASTKAPASLMNGVLAKAKAATSTSAEPTSRDALLEERRRKRGEVREKRREKTKERKRKERDDPASLAGDRKRKRGEEDGGSMLPPTASIGKVGAMSDIKKALKKEGRRQPPAMSADNDDDMDLSTSAPSTSAMATSAKAVVPAPPKASTSSSATPSSGIAFSSLDFASSSAIKSIDTPKLSKKQRDNLTKSTKTGVTSHDPSVALAALSKREEFLSKLTPQARERAEEKDKWERMNMRAEGTKVYDEEAKLKKMVKRKEKAKDKSRKDWADRKETTANAQAAQQKKRQENINNRLQAKKDKKLGVKPKKSLGKPNPKKKGRPGFEGKGGSSGAPKRK